jgi:hypothetical protein
MGGKKGENASAAAFTGSQVVAACYEIKICTMAGLPG